MLDATSNKITDTITAGSHESRQNNTSYETNINLSESNATSPNNGEQHNVKIADKISVAPQQQEPPSTALARQQTMSICKEDHHLTNGQNKDEKMMANKNPESSSHKDSCKLDSSKVNETNDSGEHTVIELVDSSLITSADAQIVTNKCNTKTCELDRNTLLNWQLAQKQSEQSPKTDPTTTTTTTSTSNNNNNHNNKVIEGTDQNKDNTKDNIPQSSSIDDANVGVTTKSSNQQQVATNTSSKEREHKQISKERLENNKQTINHNYTDRSSSEVSLEQQQQNKQSPSLSSNNDNNLNEINNNYNSNQNLLFLPSHHYFEGFENCKQRKLSYLQTLLLRKWPCLAIGICIMCSLIFSILLSAITVYLMHGLTDCAGISISAAAIRAASVSAGAGGGSSPLDLLSQHDTLRGQADFDAPLLDVASLAAGSGPVEGRSQQYSAALLMGSNGQEAGGPSAVSHNFRRLSSSLWPIHYDLFIQPYIAEPFNFSGKVSIRIKCTEPTDNITLHSLDLSLNEQTISLKLAQPTTGDQQQVNSSSTTNALARDQQEAPKVKGLSQDKELQYSIIGLDKKLEAGQEYLLGIDFTGTLNDDLAGFYKIKYERQNSTGGNEITWIAATQFQATDARRAFPCFDEPLYKATFSIQIKHWKNMTALSNMPIIDQQDSPDGLWVTDTFSKSHRMSTYLVAYAVTNFESRSEGNISVWTRPGLAHTAEYALKIAGKILRHYEDFFGIEYPLPKMDMIALPDFNAGAMENWGLITYRETAMLYDANSSSVANKQRVAIVVAHELAHQWFGNLVTPKWWDDLWLNEGFASYVEYLGVDHVEPMWRMLDQFVVEEVQQVFRLDSLSSSHQISIPVNNPDEISEIFDHISYSKGSSIIRMMSNFLTEDVFKAGLRRYLRALKYSNAEQKDLWAHLTEGQKFSNNKLAPESMIDVEKVMNSWTLQTGYPLVTLTRKYSHDKKQQQTATLEQIRYQTKLISSSILNNQKSYYKNETTNNSTVLTIQKDNVKQQKWEIPITMTSKSEQNWKPTTKLWLHQNDTKIIEVEQSLLPSKSNDDWIIMNVNQVGYYRVNYDMDNWKLLSKQLNEDYTKISTINRAQIIDDVFELAKTGLLDYRFVMNLSKYIKNEIEFLPFDSMFMSTAYIDDMLHRTPIYGAWRDYMTQLMAPYYNRYKDYDWTITKGKQQFTDTNQTTSDNNNNILGSNDVLEHYNQVTAISWACQVDEHCKQKAKSVFDDWRSNGKNIINPALRYTVYCTVIENGNKEEWNFLWNAYNKEQNASEKDRILRALTCTKEHWIIARYLEWIFDKTKPIRRQDGAYVFRWIAKNDYGRDLAFNFMRERWSILKEQYGKSSFSMGHLVRSVANSMNANIELTQLKTFYEQIKSDVGTGKRAFQIAIEEVEGNIAWKERNYKILEDWLHSNGPIDEASKI